MTVVGIEPDTSDIESLWRMDQVIESGIFICNTDTRFMCLYSISYKVPLRSG